MKFIKLARKKKTWSRHSWGLGYSAAGRYCRLLLSTALVTHKASIAPIIPSSPQSQYHYPKPGSGNTFLPAGRASPKKVSLHCSPPQKHGKLEM
ncbi:hypothetical protein [Spirosoma foliorum]|uniref:Uncharacterized protein n=1 Tax=Spirosoma foliorum TaxID=2710596 RepID=A0A7G5GQ30_9BACT|nr:hypothetical protein [Spirosoma foliorum]QMW00972.1 hypothetical protein H3H32_23745 [Spirosoma foliorum]